jgi:hypothetical protein
MNIQNKSMVGKIVSAESWSFTVDQEKVHTIEQYRLGVHQDISAKARPTLQQ